MGTSEGKGLGGLPAWAYAEDGTATASARSDPNIDDPAVELRRLDDELVATIEACERRRLELLAELARTHKDRVAAIGALRARHPVIEVAGLLGVSRQQVYRMLRS